MFSAVLKLFQEDPNHSTQTDQVPYKLRFYVFQTNCHFLTKLLFFEKGKFNETGFIKENDEIATSSKTFVYVHDEQRQI